MEEEDGKGPITACGADCRSVGVGGRGAGMAAIPRCTVPSRWGRGATSNVADVDGVSREVSTRRTTALPRLRLPGRFGGANRGGAVSRPGAHENRSPACGSRGGANPGEVRPLRRFNIAITVRYTRKGAVGSVSSVFTTAFTSVHSRLSFTTVVHNRLSFTTACRSQPPCPRPCCALASRLCEDAIFFGHP